MWIWQNCIPDSFVRACKVYNTTILRLALRALNVMVNLVLLHVGADPVQDPSVEHVRVESPFMLYSVAHAYVTMEIDKDVVIVKEPLDGACNASHSTEMQYRVLKS